MNTEDTSSWDQLRAEAADWLARMDSGSADPSDFEAWRAADPRHAVAFAQILSVTRALDKAKPDLKAELPPVRAVNRRHLLWGSVGLVGVLGGGLAYSFATARASVVTGIGQTQSVNLPLGARMELNTDTRVEWKAQGTRLDVWLKRGEVALTLTDPRQVCRLFSPTNEARLTNSYVNARLRGGLLDLSVMRGACAVKSREGRGGIEKPVVVQARQAVLASADQQIIRPLAQTDLNLITGWPNGELVVQGQTLESVVTEYNRYTTRKIVIADPALANIRIGGRFTTRDPKVFLEALHDGFGISVVDDGGGAIALTRA
ncbi:MAG: FecR family protein [Asticcacaulis sp.]|uniref:FecR family protein n=1 Tax=Asticcacaulis sp. TaxID=1872648 RepID=UPI003F7CBFD3